MTPIVIGLDLSLTGTGLASSVGWSRLLRPAAATRSHLRLQWIRTEVLEAIPADVAMVVLEGPSYGNQGSQRQSGHHERAGLWWLVAHALWRRDIAYAVASPASRAKYATGKGNAAKADVVREVARRFAWFAGGEDEADASVLAAMGADRLGYPIAEMPQTHRKALDAVRWPDGLSAPRTAQQPSAEELVIPGGEGGSQAVPPMPTADAWATTGAP